MFLSMLHKKNQAKMLLGLVEFLQQHNPLQISSKNVQMHLKEISLMLERIARMKFREELKKISI